MSIHPFGSNTCARDEVLAGLLVDSRVLSHPLVVGEVFLGHLRQRNLVLDAMKGLPWATIANDDEVLHFIARHSLFGSGIGYVDAHLLAATKMTDDARIWTPTSGSARRRPD